MEVNTIEKPCAKCTKSERIAMCCGCEQSFCTKHFIKHRLYLAQQMDSLHEKYEAFQEDLNRDKFEQPLLTSIYAWERKSIRKIQEIAEKARNDYQELIEKNKTDVKNSLEKTLLKFESNAKSDDYTELDLKKWTRQLEELQSLLETSSNISIVQDKKTSSVIRGIKVIERSSSPVSIPSINESLLEKVIEYSPEKVIEYPPEKIIERNQEYFVSGIGPCKLSEENRVVRHSNYRAGLSQLSGTNSYSSGKHFIDFLIEKKGNKNIFIGIMSSANPPPSSSFDYSVHGWWNLDHMIINGESDIGDSNDTIQAGDKLTLTIDCDNQNLQFEHYRTKKIVNLPIKLEVCPYPWKLMVRLLTTGDCVRIL